jgi:hypothetical protein
MSNIEIGNKDNLRVVRTIREKNYQKYSLSAEDRNKNYLVTQTIKPNQDFFSSMLLLQNNRTGEIKHATSRRMFVQYGEEINYPENEWKQLLAYEVYQGSKNDLYTWAMYLVPKDAIEGERFYVEDVIDDIVVQRFWDSIIRAKDGVGIWNGINLEIDENCYKDTYVIG